MQRRPGVNMLVNRLSMSALLVAELAADVGGCEASLLRMTCNVDLVVCYQYSLLIMMVKAKCHLAHLNVAERPT